MSPASGTFSELDHAFMARAVRLARRGEGRVEPNPMVGCVIAREGRVIGEGYHRRFGGPHAEAEALGSCGSKAGGATAFVTLEPCSHYGKTPPCVEALLAAKVKRVVIPFVDPNPLVRGRGVQRLRRAGVRVELGLMCAEASALIAPFATRVLCGRPYVIAKWAQTLDGKWATRTGDSRWISGERSRRFVHRLRGRVDAVVVGAGTVESDDPRLTAREVPLRRTARRVVLDATMRVDPDRRLFRGVDAGPVVLFTARDRSESAKAKRFAARGVIVVGCRTHANGLVIADVLRWLARQDCTNVLIEGGPTLVGAFLDAGAVDEALVFIAPKLVADPRAPGLVLARPPATIEAAPSPTVLGVHRFDGDVGVRLRLNDPPWPA